MKTNEQVEKMRRVTVLRDQVLEAVIRGHPSDEAFSALSGLMMKVAIHMSGNDLERAKTILEANFEMVLAGLEHSKVHYDT